MSNKELPASAARARPLLGLAGWIILCFSAPALGAFAKPDTWYAALKKPSWNPPGWVFGPVWTFLYMAMAVAAWLVWRQGGVRMQRGPLLRFVVQLALNAAWTPLFFGLHRPDLALIDIVLLWIAISATIAVFRKISKTAAWLLVPYLAWVSFATVLNFVLWRMNS